MIFSHKFSSVKSLIIMLLFSSGINFLISGCGINSSTKKVTKPEISNSNSPPQFISVDVETARFNLLGESREYIGSTKPYQEVSLRSQVEGRLLELRADVGDFVKKGTIVGILDDSLLAAQVNEAEAELMARESELARAKAERNNAIKNLERTKIELKQAQNDAKRANLLLEEGAISRQSAELSQTTAEVAQQAVLSAQEQIKIEEEEIAVTLGRIGVQKAIITQEKQRQAYTSLVVPVDGIVIDKISEPGDLINPGGEVLKIGDFSKIKIVVPMSDLQLSKINMGQSVTVKLDAFPQEFFNGFVSKIPPIANSETRQIPIEITVNNPEQKISSGLLARVTFTSNNKSMIIIPESAIQTKEGKNILFVLKNKGENNLQIVEAREVMMGDRQLGKVEVIKGLEVGEKFVTNSARPLKDQQEVKLSILSE